MNPKKTENSTMSSPAFKPGAHCCQLRALTTASYHFVWERPKAVLESLFTFVRLRFIHKMEICIIKGVFMY